MSDATIPAVVQDAQRYDWREDLDSIEACEEVSECADGCCTDFMPRHNDECIRLAAYIERLEAERVIMRNGNVMTQGDYEWLATVRDELMLSQEKEARKLHALLAEHEAARYLFDPSPDNLDDLYTAYDNAERVIRG